MQKPEFIIDGDRFSTLEGFFDEIGRVLIPGAVWGRNLNAFNDILRGGFGTPDDGFVLRWRNSARSRDVLRADTVRQLKAWLATCHASNRERMTKELELAECGLGPTAFDWLVEIIRGHGVGGNEAGSGVELILE